MDLIPVNEVAYLWHALSHNRMHCQMKVYLILQAKEAMGEALGADRQAQMRADEERMLRSQRVCIHYY